MVVQDPPIVAIVPAAGVGRRMGTDIPKQYLPLCGRPLIERTLSVLSSVERVVELVVAVSPQDEYWSSIRAPADKPITRIDGGAQRSHSVLNALEFLHRRGDGDAWALVHDAVRPCVRRVDVDALIDAALASDDGGLLACPVGDTMKRVRNGRVQRTEARDDLWHALTPQLFRVGVLRDAIEAALASNIPVTDESQAMEHHGAQPLVVCGATDNIKVTRKEDLALAEWLLTQRERAQCA